FFSSLIPPPPRSTLFPYTTLFRSGADGVLRRRLQAAGGGRQHAEAPRAGWSLRDHRPAWHAAGGGDARVPRGEPCPAALSVPGLADHARAEVGLQRDDALRPAVAHDDRLPRGRAEVREVRDALP